MIARVMNRFFGNHLDFFGFSASLICAVHCISLPLLLAFGSVTVAKWMANPILEWSFILVSAIIVLASIFPSYRKHGKAMVLVMAVFGLFLIGVDHLAHLHIIHHVLSAIGGVLIASAHFLNWRALQQLPAKNEY